VKTSFQVNAAASQPNGAPAAAHPDQVAAAAPLGRLRWEHRQTRRFYEAVVQQDLFGDWEVWRCWGGIGSTRGGQLHEPAPHEAAGSAAMAMLATRRRRRGYERVQPRGPVPVTSAATP